MIPPPPLTPTQLLVRSSLSLLSLILLGIVFNLTILSHLQNIVAQQQLRGLFTEQLAAGTAPVSEGDFENVLLTDGDPVARIEIPAIGVDTIVVEGTSSGTLTSGPGHRRDTRLPGQVGVSILMGRAAAYGGPFGSIQTLAPGETISVVTGQGEHIYEVIGVRYAGDPSPAPLTAGEGRLILESARGFPFAPVGVVRVDARLVSEVQPAGARETTSRTLPPSHRELAVDTGTVWALVFALQFLVLAEAAAVWAHQRVGGAKTWVVAAPVLLLAGLLVADQLVRLLPNLL
ncbi:MAG: sortase [Propionibacteriaceae bacterium]|nr:sortase [Propionibacteriaceae bacterium]